MRLMMRWLVVAWVMGTGVVALAQDPHPAKARLVSELASVQPGESVWVGVELTMDPHWHVYWINPGDSGLAPTVAWELPPGVTMGEIQWPYPRVYQVGPLISLGYENRVLLMQKMTVSKDVSAGEVLQLRAKVDWLVCEDICIPGSAALELAMPVKGELAVGNPAERELFEQTRAEVPKPFPADRVSATIEGRQLRLEVRTAPGVDGVGFFAKEEAFVKLDEGATLEKGESSFTLIVPLDRPEVLAGKNLRAVLTAVPKGFPDEDNVLALEIDVPLTGREFPPPAASGGDGLGFGVAFLFALVGGALLNLMPCVFPILSIKVLGFVQKSKADPRGLRQQGILFGVGVVVSFLVLAGLLLALRAGGEQLGWGFQLQSPFFVGFLAVLFFLIGLNLAGVFEVGAGLMRLGGVASTKNESTEAFLSGALATVVATPCTAPFMGSALGTALSLPLFQALLIFAGLGLGMAAPYVLLSFRPELGSKLPKPGPWMETFKQFLAFPMFATVIWLGWVFGLQTGVGGIVDLLSGLLLLGLAAWVWGKWNTPIQSSRARWISGFAALVIALAGAGMVRQAAGQEPEGMTASAGAVDSHGIEWIRFSPETVRTLIAEGRYVYVDFTAAWCITCQANKRVVFGSEAVREAFKELNVAAVKADWTRYDPVITDALREFGRASVPLNVVYTPREPGKGMTLTEFPLTPEEVLSALRGP